MVGGIGEIIECGVGPGREREGGLTPLACELQWDNGDGVVYFY